MMRWLLVMMAGALQACSYIVWTDVETAPVCASDDDCGAGTVCIDSLCVGVDQDTVPLEATTVDESGGVVRGPYGAVLTIPANALLGPVLFTIAPATATSLHDNFDETSPFIAIDPLVTLQAPATLTLPGDGELFRRPDDGSTSWELQTDGQLTRTGTFGRGTPAEFLP